MSVLKSRFAILAVSAFTAAVMPPTVLADRVITEDVTLAADADWSADGLVTIKPGARINLAGHNLTVADIAQETAVITNATGVVAGYKDLALIRTSSTTLGYINTDIVLDATDRVVFKVRYDAAGPAQSFFFCSRVSNNSKQFAIAYQNAGQLRVDYGAKANDVKAPTKWTAGETYEVDFNGKTKVCSINGSAVTFNKAFPDSYEASAPLCIFQISNNGTPLTGSSNDQYIPPRKPLLFLHLRFRRDFEARTSPCDRDKFRQNRSLR